VADCMSPPRDATRRQLRRYHRACLVHAAGERTSHPDCCVTALYLAPWESPNDLDDPPAPGVGHEVLALGVRIPRSLRRLYGLTKP
jgi:hypothetical protein